MIFEDVASSGAASDIDIADIADLDVLSAWTETGAVPVSEPHPDDDGDRGAHTAEAGVARSLNERVQTIADALSRLDQPHRYEVRTTDACAFSRFEEINRVPAADNARNIQMVFTYSIIHGVACVTHRLTTSACTTIFFYDEH